MHNISMFCSSLLTVLLLLTGIYFSIKTNFFQIFKLPACFKNIFNSVKRRGRRGYMSMALALGGTVGVGNISGTAVAIAIGGPGAVFWMWICGLLGMITKYAEIIISTEFKPYGPMRYIKIAFGKFGRLFAFIFSLFCILASVLIGGVFQVKAVYDTFQSVLYIEEIIIHIIVLLPVLILTYSTADFIKNISSLTVPIMSALYIIMSVIIIAINVNQLPSAIFSIIANAFHHKTTASGIMGYIFSSTVNEGISKGLFSHEAGLGSSPISYAGDPNSTPQESASFGVLEVFVDTGIITTLTALAMLTSGFYGENGMTSAALMFLDSFGSVGGILFSVTVFSFSLAAMSGWLFYGKMALFFITKNNFIYFLYSTVFVTIIPFIDNIPMNLMWDLSNVVMLFMAVPNILAVFNFRNIVFQFTKKEKNNVKFMRNLS